MSDEPTTYIISCPMEFNHTISVFRMITTHPEFSGIRIIDNPDGETNGSFSVMQIPKGEMLITFSIPRCVYMPDFFREFSKALNQQETTVAIQKERYK